ncbi:unnamed protein product [Schistocephalus solidus]|uniref:Uncharacterized protein n=1 Tax=Schistocephalus solidus TaxID=70667 RepID=A0A183T4I9_SCHSO|nr:unnamed protein product [Schistocephalus solidus]
MLKRTIFSSSPEPVLPSWLPYFVDVQMEDVELPHLLLVSHPGLRSAQRRQQDGSFVNLELDAEVENVLIPDDVLHVSEGLAGHCDPMGDLMVDFGAAGEVAFRSWKVSTAYSQAPVKLMQVASHLGILYFRQLPVHKEAPSVEGYFVYVGRVANIGFLQPDLLDEQIDDGSVVFIESLLMLTTCVTDEIQGVG